MEDNLELGAVTDSDRLLIQRRLSASSARLDFDYLQRVVASRLKPKDMAHGRVLRDIAEIERTAVDGHSRRRHGSGYHRHCQKAGLHEVGWFVHSCFSIGFRFNHFFVIQFDCYFVPAPYFWNRTGIDIRPGWVPK